MQRIKTIDLKRDQEKQKYEYLFRNQCRRRRDGRLYGGGFHAQPILDIIEGMKIKSILDVGAGNGEFVQWMWEHGCKNVYGTDIVHERPTGFGGIDDHIDWAVTPAHKLPCLTHGWEYVTAFDVLEHILPEDIDLVLNEMRRVAIKGFIFSIPSNRSTTKVNGKWVDLHLIVKPKKWWVEKLTRFGSVNVVEEEGTFYFVEFNDRGNV